MAPPTELKAWICLLGARVPPFRGGVGSCPVNPQTHSLEYPYLRLLMGLCCFESEEPLAWVTELQQRRQREQTLKRGGVKQVGSGGERGVVKAQDHRLGSSLAGG